VTLLILLGLAAGPVGFNILPPQVHDWFEFLTSAALTMIAFLLGGALSRAELRCHGHQILTISVVIVAVTVIVVGGGLIAIGVAPVLALLFSGIASATAPAATIDVLQQTGAKNNFAQTLRGIVAVDDAWGLIVFSIMLICANVIIGNGILAALEQGLWELFGAFVVGAAIGFPAAFLTGRLRPGEPIQAEALAVVFLCAGVAVWLKVSFLISGIVAGMIVVNFAKHHTRAFHEIERIEWPFMILFFFLAGASLEAHRWLDFGLITMALVVLRVVSRIAGGWIGGKLSATPDVYNRWIGIALLPQAGVAVGMALVAADHFPEVSEVILTVTITTTVIFEIFGPIGTRLALEKVGNS
jgi:Kef-type K+ transport system membrane component KefB